MERTIALFLVGIVLVVKGGDFFVSAASWMAEVSGIPKLIVGATVVSLATTLPELLVSALAAVQGKVDMAVGNAVGSVTANIGLIMAIALLFLPTAIRRRDYWFKAGLMLAAAALVVLCGRTGRTGPGTDLALLSVFTLFLWENVTSARQSIRRSGGKTRRHPGRREVAVNLVKFGTGAAGILWGAALLVDNGSALARLAGVSERIIGVTVIAVGTSLPELITTVTAILKKQSALSVGNILGANIIDLTLILPLSALLAGRALPITAPAARLDLPACLLVGCIALAPPMLTRRFSRKQGAALLAVYGAYLVLTCRAL